MAMDTQRFMGEAFAQQLRAAYMDNLRKEVKAALMKEAEKVVDAAVAEALAPITAYVEAVQNNYGANLVLKLIVDGAPRPIPKPEPRHGD